MERSNTVLPMENKYITSLKVWKQTQEKIKLIAAIERKTMFVALDEMADEKLKQLQGKEKNDAHKSV